MNIKIESGAKVQITDKPIYNIFGDVVQQKTVLPSSASTSKSTDGEEKSGQKPFNSEKVRRPSACVADARNRKAKDYTRRSFILHVSMSRLKMLYTLLSEKGEDGRYFIDGNMQAHNDVRSILQLENDKEYEKVMKETKPVDIDKMLFCLVFTGQDTDVRIVWRAHANELLYLIDTMSKKRVVVSENGKNVTKPLLEWLSGPRKWQLTRFRFMDGKPRKVMDERTGKEVTVDEPIEFSDNAFEKQNYPANTTRLDDIINKIVPCQKSNIHEEIANDFEGKGNHRKNTADSLGSLKAEGNFRDISHKRRE